MLRLYTFGGLSLEQEGRLATGSISQKRRLALLAVLAASGSTGVSRDRAALLLWPESDTESARHSLAQLLYSIRRSLPDDAITSTSGNISLNPAIVWSDVEEFERLIKNARYEAADPLYRGPFLHGFNISGAREFEEWMTAERANRERQIADALESLAVGAATRGDHDGAVAWWKRLASLQPLDSRVAVGLITALHASGNLPGALQYAARHESMVREQLGITADPAVSDVRDAIVRQATPPRGVSQETLANASRRPSENTPAVSSKALPAEPSESTISRTSRGAASYRRLLGWALGCAILVLGVAGVWRSTRADPTGVRVKAANSTVAVVPFSYEGDSAQRYLEDGIVELMSANLDGAGDIRAVSPRPLLAYVHERSGGSRNKDPDSAAAAHFNARYFLSGNITSSNGRLRITATLRERIPEPHTVASATVEGRGDKVFALLDGLTAQLLAGRYSSPIDRLSRTAARTTYSLPALKAHLTGERRFRQGRYAEAVEAFQSAVSYDSTFALGYYRLAIATEFAQLLDLGYNAAERAVAHADRLSPHDRKLVHAYSARRRGDADRAERLYEEVLLTYPDDAEAWFQLGEVLFHQNAYRGRSFVEAERVWEKALTFNRTDHFSLVHLARIYARKQSSQLVPTLNRAIATATPADAMELRCFAAATTDDGRARRQCLNDVKAAPASTVWQTIGRVGVYTHDLELPEELGTVMINGSSLPATQSLGNAALMLIMLGKGQVGKAGEHVMRASMTVPVSARVPNPHFESLGFLPVDTAAIQELRRRLQEWKPAASGQDSVLDASYAKLRNHQRWYLLGLLSIRLGDRNATERSIQVLDTLTTVRVARGLPKMFVVALKANLALAAGDPSGALRILESSHATVPIELSSVFGAEQYSGWLRAESLRQLGRCREAISWYATRVDLFPVDFPYLGPSEFRLAQCYEKLGDNAQAKLHYREFLNLWKSADPPLAPFMVDAQNSLSRLDHR